MATTEKVSLASFKLRFADDHVRIVPAEGLDGRPFHGPGVDLRGEEARACLDLARPMVDWLLARQPSVVPRALSVDLRSRRVLVSFDDAHAPAGTRPMVLRIEAAESGELLDRAAAVVLRLSRVAAEALRRRSGA